MNEQRIKLIGNPPKHEKLRKSSQQRASISKQRNYNKTKNYESISQSKKNKKADNIEFVMNK